MTLDVELDVLVAVVRNAVPAPCRVTVGGDRQGVWARISVSHRGLQTGARARTTAALQDALTQQVIPDLAVDLAMLDRGSLLADVEQADVLLDPFLAATLIHECIGHTSEADNYEEYGHLLGLRLGQPWTTTPLTVTDDPTAPAHNGSFATDDEGTPAAPVDLLRDGVWAGLLTSRRHTAGQRPNGHGRRPVGSTGAAMPRIGHLKVGAGHTPTALLASSLSGYRLGGIDGAGSVRDLVVVRPRWAQRYVQGQPGDVVTGLEIRARKVQLMRRLTAVGDTVTTYDPFHPCAKNDQDVFVTMSAPPLLLHDVRLYPRSSG